MSWPSYLATSGTGCIPHTEQVHPHRDIERECPPRCHQRDQRRGDIDRESHPIAPANSPDSLSIDLRAKQLAARDRLEQQVERATAKDKRSAIEGNCRTYLRASKVGRKHRGREWDEGHIGEYAAVRELYWATCRVDQPHEVVMDDPRDQNHEEAERKREVVRPERHEAGPQTTFDSRMLKADLENQQGNRDGKDAVAERLDAVGAFGQCNLLCAV